MIQSLIILMVAGLGLVLILKARACRLRHFILAGLGAILFTTLIHAIRLPIERIHIFEYAILAILLDLTFRLDYSHKKAGFLSFCFSISVGVTDEITQMFIPNRYYATNDILLNMAGVGVGFLFLAFFRWMGQPRSPVDRG